MLSDSRQSGVQTQIARSGTDTLVSRYGAYVVWIKSIMAFAAETFGNINSRSGLAPRRKKKSQGIRPGTVVTGIAVVGFAWVAATLLTAQSMVLSLPGADSSAQDLLTPKASAFIVPQGHASHIARLSSSAGTQYAQHRPTDGASAVRAQLASALAQQATELQAAQVVRGGRPVIAASPTAVDRLRKVIAVNFATTVQSLAQTKIALASLQEAAEQAKAEPPPVEVALAVPADAIPAPIDVVPLPMKDTDLPVAEVLPAVIPLARPAHIVAKAPAAVPDASDEPDSNDTVVAPPSHLLAYAKPNEETSSKPKPFLNPFAAISPRGGSGTAIYDISAGTVYLPSGERLEAHSGLGHMRDNPRYVDRKNTGPTPPETYNLTYRESLFHGVQALRLTPPSGARVYGRDGLLAHTYMLRGSRGDSNGCVVFKDYARFLAAFKRGEIKRIQVVTHLSSPPSNMASR